MNKINLRRDTQGAVIQSLSPAGTPTTAALSGVSQALALPSNAALIRIASSGNCWIKFGTSGVAATTSDTLFPAGVEIFSVDSSWTHMAVLQEAGASGNISITEMQ